MSGNWISIFSNSDIDLDHRHLGSNHKLRLDVSYLYSKFRVNKPKQTKVIERKPKVDARPPARRRLQNYNNPVFVENLVEKQFLVVLGLKRTWSFFYWSIDFAMTNQRSSISCDIQWFTIRNCYCFFQKIISEYTCKYFL